MPENLIKKCGTCQVFQDGGCLPSLNYQLSRPPSERQILVTTPETICIYPQDYQPLQPETSTQTKEARPLYEHVQHDDDSWGNHYKNRKTTLAKPDHAPSSALCTEARQVAAEIALGEGGFRDSKGRYG